MDGRYSCKILAGFVGNFFPFLALVFALPLFDGPDSPSLFGAVFRFFRAGVDGYTLVTPWKAAVLAASKQASANFSGFEPLRSGKGSFELSFSFAMTKASAAFSLVSKEPRYREWPV